VRRATVSRSIDSISVRGLVGLIARAPRPIKLAYDRLNDAFSARAGAANTVRRFAKVALNGFGAAFTVIRRSIVLDLSSRENYCRLLQKRERDRGVGVGRRIGSNA